MLGQDISEHRSVVLEDLVSQGSAVVVFERRHIREVRRRVPRARVYLLTELAGERGSIADPDGGDEATYTECFRRIVALSKKVARA